MLGEWLDTLDWPAPQRDDIVLAVNEALANVVDHAYPPDTPGQAQLYAWEALEPQRQLRRVVAVVTDRGRWKPGMVGPSYRGRGLPMMDACMASVQIEPSPAAPP
jgi:anti-sigma regulatory factor (Ser/Thr protein kinase)